MVEIYTDGACKGNPGPGGWGAILRSKDNEKELKGFEAMTTNNRMELTAAIEALTYLSKVSQVDLYTDSNYLRQGMQSWIAQWKKKNWRNSKNEPVKNIDLWKKLDELAKYHSINWHWVKGHSGHPENERADALANEAILSMEAN
ncbi:MAG: ribonuclease HI [Legionellaceae bacterium]|nr:ribonuclease HI [Legionellaceae bacterium]